MPRKKTPKDTETSILTKSRRRCCICYGLNRDTGIKQGQIAHLDQDATNIVEDNLAFLCMPHHDQYDSKTRQSKNLTISEVKHYRSELLDALQKILQAEVSFGEIKLTSDNSIAGKYIRPCEYAPAELVVSRLLDGRYHVSGWAYWGVTREFGPNMGNLDFVAELEKNTITYSWYPDWDDSGERKVYTAHLKFSPEGLVITEENAHETAIFGMNVCFEGEYAKAPHPYEP